jgi:hypothetical protein
MSIAWHTVEDALHAWAVAGTGLAAEQVIWAQQAGPRPEGPYVSLRLITVQPLGQDWSDSADADDPQPGAEIAFRTRGVREAQLSVQCFAGVDGNATGGATPLARLMAMVAIARAPFQQTALNAAGIGVASFGPVQSIDAVLGSSVFEPRAVMDVRLFLAAEVVTVGTYVEFVEIANLNTGTNTWVPEEPA